MTAVSSLAFPPSRNLVGWWKQLGSYQPQAMWIGYLAIHHVEALVSIRTPGPIDSLNLFALRALALHPGCELQHVEDRLHVGRQIAWQMLQQLAAERLAEVNDVGRWTLTPMGVGTLKEGSYRRRRLERRTFYFIQGEDDRPAQFLPLASGVCTPWPAAMKSPFNPAVLRSCIGQTEAWKRERGFPAEIDELVDESRPDFLRTEPWQRIILAYPERLSLVLILDRQVSVHAFPLRPEGWTLRTERPAFSLGAYWRETLPDLAVDPSLEEWRAAWQSWSQQRTLPGAEVDNCMLRRDGHRLCVQAPVRLVERLRNLKSDALKNEAWVLAGGDSIKTAALLDIAPA
jgi:hypothetical protein